MISVDQSVLHDPDNGQHGDCFRACIASLLEKPISDVPHFLHDGCDAAEFWKRINEYLATFGLCYFEFSNFDMETLVLQWGIGDIYYIVSGRTERGTYHATIALNGKVVHDPHPSKTGLTDMEPWVLGFLIRLNGRSA